MIARRLETSRNISREQCSFRVLGVSVDAVQIPDAIAEMERWIREGRAGCYIAVTGMHGITVSR